MFLNNSSYLDCLFCFVFWEKLVLFELNSWQSQVLQEEAARPNCRRWVACKDLMQIKTLLPVIHAASFRTALGHPRRSKICHGDVAEAEEPEFENEESSSAAAASDRLTLVKKF